MTSATSTRRQRMAHWLTIALLAPTLLAPAQAPTITIPQAAATPAAYTAPAPPTAQQHYRAPGQNPLPTGSNAQNLPLYPGNERHDYALRPYAPGQPIVLMSISGGGSRSAYYAARVMEELARVPLPGIHNPPMPDGRPSYSLLDSVRVISTVSAGGLASTWYTLNYERRKEPAFFDEMKSAVSVNLQWQTYGHMALFPPLAVQLLASSVTRTDLLANEIDAMFGKRKLTFNDLRARETHPVDPAPTLLINGTVYNSGQRLVMTNLPGTRFPSIISEAPSNITMSEQDQQILRNLMQPLTFGDLGSDIGQYPISKALAASAAYPILLAPVPLRIYPQHVPQGLLRRIDKNLLESDIAYVADGGLYENEGVDPLLSLIRSLPPTQPVLLLIIDGSQRMETMKLREGKIFGPTTVLGRMYDIGALKPLAYYPKVLDDFRSPDNLQIVSIRMEGYDETTQETLRNIPTQFKLSTKHRDCLDDVATRNVQNMLPSILHSYQTMSKKPTKKKSTR